jgi:hypothetical protein
MNKLGPIYAAFDMQQYSKAVKLCLALPASNTLVQALLAHAYVKSGHRYKGLLTLQSILGTKNFPELQLEIKYAMERREESPPQPSPQSQPASRKSGKKGKKKVVSAPTVPDPAPVIEDWDLVDQLDTPPTLPDDWEDLPPADQAFTDDTLLSTLAVTLRSHLKMPLTVYQIFCWAASSDQANSLILGKAFLAGLAVLVAPQYEHITSPILANMQVLALQLARVQQQFFGEAPATAWAAQTALWQLAYSDQSQLDEKQLQRLQLLPRLAESLAAKCIQDKPSNNNEESLILTENFLLYMRTLDFQAKWEDKLKALDERLATSAALVYPSRPTLLDLKADVFQKLGKYAEACELIEKELLRTYPDNWSYWKRYLECSQAEDAVEGLERTGELITRILSNLSDQRYPLRGPHLMKVELAADRVRGSEEKSQALNILRTSIEEYGNIFASLASCAFTDLVPYFDLFLEFATDEDTKLAFEWLKRVGVEPNSADSGERKRQLRVYIFTIQMMNNALRNRPAFGNEYGTKWNDLLQVWQDFQAFDLVEDDDQVRSFRARCTTSWQLLTHFAFLRKRIDLETNWF